MKKIDKIDVFRFIGETLYDYYKRKSIRIFPEYDTSHITEDTDVYELARKTFVKPYLDEIERGNDLTEDLQYVLSVIKNSLTDYDKIKKEDQEKLQDAYSLTVDKALIGDTGSSYE